jgi:hypothetical protein
MNAFQKQLKLGDKCMAELAGQDRDGVGRAIPPARVSVEEFEATRETVCRTCGGYGVVANHLRRYVRKCPTCKGTGK